MIYHYANKRAETLCRAPWSTRRVGLLLTLCLAMASVGCHRIIGSSTSAARTYTIAFTVREPPSPFATPAHGGPHWVVCTYLFDSLVWKDQNGFVPLLADNWQSSEDKQVWTFDLRQGVRWHDGQPFTADDVKFTFDYLRDHPFPMNAAEIATRIDRVEATSPTQVRFYLKQPWQDFLDDVAGIVLILPRHIWQSVTDPVKFLDASAFTGTGPFKYVETRRGEYHLFQTNPDYFLGRSPFDRLVFKAVNNPPLALESGDVDAASFNSPAAVARFQDRPAFVTAKGPYSYYLSKLIFNVSRPPFDAKGVRQAFAYALNRQDIVNKVLNGGGMVSSAGLLHPDSNWFNPGLPKYNPDKVRAEELLTQAGFTRNDASGIRESADGTRRLSFTMYVRNDNSPDMSRTAEMVRDQLAQVGVHLDIKPLNTGPLEGILSQGDFDITLDGHGGTLRPEFVADNADFPAHVYRNEELKRLRDQFLSASDDRQRRDAAWKIQSIIADDLPGLGIYNPNSPVVYRKSKGVNWFWTKQGLGGGAPIWFNKLALVKADGSPVVADVSVRRLPGVQGIAVAGGVVIVLIFAYSKFHPK